MNGNVKFPASAAAIHNVLKNTNESRSSSVSLRSALASSISANFGSLREGILFLVVSPCSRIAAASSREATGILCVALAFHTGIA